ncbi:hypothetical protein ES705_12084 [subsurface metagenome]
MADTFDPYKSPDNQAEEQSEGVLTANSIEFLSKTTPWVRFIGVLYFIGLGFMALIAIIVMLSGTIGGVFSESLGGYSILASLGLGSIYLVFAGIMFFPALYLYRYGSKLKTFLITREPQDLEASLKNNKSFWKFLGIISIIYLSIIPLAIIISIIVGIAQL